LKRIWVDPKTVKCPERVELNCEDPTCIGRKCTRWDKANDHCIRYRAGWVEES